jgi:hypothetical protein
LKKYIVGAFTPESWDTHGKDWLAAVKKLGTAVLVFNTAGDGFELYDGTQAGLIAALAKRDGVFLFAGPNVRVQKSVEEIFELAADKVVAFGRESSCVRRPFHGSRLVHEDFWAAPSDLLDMLARVIEMSFGTGSSPPHFDANYVGYFVEFFPWFASVLPAGFAHQYDADLVDDYYSSPGGDPLIAVALATSN